MKAEPQGSGLPAPYRSPWHDLCNDLRAVAASLRLKLWELTRLNREGALPLPSRWPDRLAALFWPLVLLLGFAVVTLVVGMLLARTPTIVPPPERAEPPRERPSAAPAPAPTAQEEEGPQEPPTEPATPLPPVPSAGPPAPGSLTPGSAGDEPAEPPKEPEPLLRQLGREGEADPLLAEAQPVPAAGVLRLRLAAGFARLSRQERQERAEQWQEQAARLGYERLELQDERGRPLGRSALVGSGMILLDPVPSA